MVAKQQDTTAPSPAAQTASQGAELLRLALSCPNCGVTGWVKWSSLERGIHCPKCKCQFLIGRTGQIHDMRSLPKTRYTCPRCGKSGSIPATFVVQKSECTDCKLPLVAGPDQRLHGVKEAAALHKAAQARRESYASWLHSNFRHSDGRLRVAHLLVASILLLAVTIGGALGIRSWLDGSPETLARRFTQRCLAGDFARAAGYLDDDDVQRIEFQRWQMRHFTSIISKYRPTGDRVAVDVHLLQEQGDQRTVRVELSSAFLGKRAIEQVWRKYDDAWRFDATATLRKEDLLVGGPSGRR
jgi:ribosomal protein L37E